MKDKLLFIRNTTTAQTRNETLDGKDYLVVPCVMIVEGVHNGSQGPLFYSENELSKFICCWNMKPALLRHPDSEDSGTDLNILKNQGCGILLNTEYADGKLKTEIWLDVEKANQLDSRIVERIENEEMIEVSTGLFTELDAMPGTWNEESYISKALNFRPDHLAILLDAKGACSINDGAGLLRNKANKVTKNELSHDRIREDLNNLIRENLANDKWAWTMDVYEKYFVYETDSNYYQQDYTISSDDVVTLVGEVVEVERKVEYKPVTQNQEVDVKRDEMIAALIANGKFNDGDQPFLKGLDDNQLGQLTANMEKSDDKPVENDAGGAPIVAPVVNKEAGSQPVANTVVPQVAPITVESFLSTAPPEVQAVLNQGIAALNKRKTDAVEKILANEANIFTAEVLNAKSADELEAIAALAGTPAVKPTENAEEGITPVANADVPVLETQTLYAPQPGAVPTTNEDIPVLNTQELFPNDGGNK